MENNSSKPKITNHAWKGTWNRPMKINEAGLHPFTIARMTDHNVRGSDDPGYDDVRDVPEGPPERSFDKNLERDPNADDFSDPSESDQAA